MKEQKLIGEIKYHSYRLGGQNKFGQYYLVRNASFELSMFNLQINDLVDNFLSQINTAPRLKKSAIICSNRINYVGYLDEANSGRNLRLLEVLLEKVKKNWPDVKFMDSMHLGQLIAK